MQKIIYLLGVFVFFIFAGCAKKDSVMDVSMPTGEKLWADEENGFESDVYLQNIIGDTVNFEVNSSSLSLEAKNLLEEQVDWLLRNPRKTALIEGHADERGTRIYNIALGARRASAVRDFMVSRGIPDDRFETISYGKERPLEVCSQEICYRKNRRAVVRIDQPQKQQ